MIRNSDTYGVLANLIAEIEQHGREFENHRTGCDCMDHYVREVKGLIESPDYQDRVNYVFRTAAKQTNNGTKKAPANSGNGVATRAVRPAR